MVAAAPLLVSLDDACHRFDQQQVHDILMHAPAAFEPTDGICDLVWLAKQHTITENIVKLPVHNVDFLLARN